MSSCRGRENIRNTSRVVGPTQYMCLSFSSDPKTLRRLNPLRDLSNFFHVLNFEASETFFRRLAMRKSWLHRQDCHSFVLGGFSSKHTLFQKEPDHPTPCLHNGRIKGDDDLGANGRNSKLFEASGRPTTTPSTERIHNLERQILEGKLVLGDDDGKSLK
ncbi:hypothetical protein Tco_0241830 [Tanacetum coccineum]